MNNILKCLNGAILLCLVFIACQKDSTNGPIPCQVSSLQFDSFQFRMNYNADGSMAEEHLLNRGITKEFSKYTYTPGQIIYTTYSADSVLLVTSTYTIGSNGFASLCVNTSPTNTGTDSSFYTYNSEGYLTGIRQVSYAYRNGTAAWSGTLLTARTIANGNKVKETIAYRSIDAETNFDDAVTYEYFTDKAGYIGLFGDNVFEGKYSTSLLKKTITTTNAKNGYGSTIVYSYEFDTEGKPTKVSYATTGLSGSTSTRSMLLQFACNY
jgi:hypothetical protein